jgi:uncharacterized protein YneF (UPF0154 family)
MTNKHDVLFWLLFGGIILCAFIFISGGCWIAYKIVMGINAVQ